MFEGDSPHSMTMTDVLDSSWFNLGLNDNGLAPTLESPGVSSPTKIKIQNNQTRLRIVSNYAVFHHKVS